MAGIGFTLRRLTQRDDLIGAVIGYGHSVFISAGPWLLTVLALIAINLILTDAMPRDSLELFRSIIVYNFSVSLVITGPVILVATRYLADRVFEKRVDTAPALMVTAMVLGTAPGLLLAAWFYLVVCTIPIPLALLALANYAVISAIWVAGLFLSALKAYVRVTVSFGLGMAGSVALTYLVGAAYGPIGALAAFSGGLALTMLVLMATVLAEYRYPMTRPVNLLRYFRDYWELALGGLVYNLAIWIDKWVLWATLDDTSVVGGALVTAPLYDGAMFLAYLTIVPALAIFTVAVETRFFEDYQRFYRQIGDHSTLEAILENQRGVERSATDGLRSVMVIQIVISVLVIFFAPTILDAAGGASRQIGMFRFGVLGALFHVLMLFCGILLMYFDARRPALTLNIVFLATNGAFTWATSELGFPYLGYGYFASTLVCFALGVVLLFNVLRHLPYYTFVRNNPSVTGA
ncbi:exopolysaccharide Pel transporter PelG [Thalassobaculum sp. OXR-137]|uniref:exopolysaccharide Pel transporter PelG n=1 Tax=Thalassobaculum sp. OXR-137 TaxID=3100173 RepID=UPI002AC97AB7|nr:exopolysaccharide Pel transporter PelG [Thalassobaculum sp. OXR-137]WPZ33491.1 exopolysaccharide Pel transporter PelG [Thalassobaculum sp. OXR-137]